MKSEDNYTEGQRLYGLQGNIYIYVGKTPRNRLQAVNISNPELNEQIIDITNARLFTEPPFNEQELKFLQVQKEKEELEERIEQLYCNKNELDGLGVDKYIEKKLSQYPLAKRFLDLLDEEKTLYYVNVYTLEIRYVYRDVIVYCPHSKNLMFLDQLDSVSRRSIWSYELEEERTRCYNLTPISNEVLFDTLEEAEACLIKAYEEHDQDIDIKQFPNWLKLYKSHKKPLPDKLLKVQQLYLAHELEMEEYRLNSTIQSIEKDKQRQKEFLLSIEKKKKEISNLDQKLKKLQKKG